MSGCTLTDCPRGKEPKYVNYLYKTKCSDKHGINSVRSGKKSEKLLTEQDKQQSRKHS
jgi:hypothetical protein